MEEFVKVPTRIGIEGALDKGAIVAAIAIRNASENRRFIDLVRSVVSPYSDAQEQAFAWFNFCESRTYLREFGEIFASPLKTAQFGGDCDDMVILLMSGILAIGIPCHPEIIVSGENGVHIRLRVGFPPHNPPKNVSDWTIMDPTKHSETKWVGASSEIRGPSVKTSLVGESNQIPTKSFSLVTVAAVIAAIIFVSSKIMRNENEHR